MKTKILLPDGKDSGFEVYQRPPTGLNVASATPEEIARLGYPRRPEDPAALKRYLELFRQLKDSDYIHNPALTPSEHKFPYRAGKKVRPDGVKSVDSESWSGAVLTPPAGKSFTIVQATFVVPTLLNPANTELQIFVGMDFGAYNGDVGGAGLGLECFGGPWQGILLIGGAYYGIPALVAQPGQSITISISVASSTSLDMNLTMSNGKLTGTQTVPGPLGGNAEFVVASGPAGDPNPPNFGTLTFTSVCVGAGGPPYYAPGNAAIETVLIDMVDYKGDKLSNATLDAGNVVCKYAGPYPPA